MKFGSAIQVLLLLAVSFSAGAQQPESYEASNVLNLYTGQGVDHNLSNLPGSILTADINWDQSYFVGISYGKATGRYQDAFPVLADNALGSIVQGYEVVLLKHHGLQDNVEFGAAYTLKSPYWTLGAVQLQAGTGIGLSHAFSRPNYEDGPFDDPDRRYQTQLMLLFELRMRMLEHKQWSVFGRVQHRSGAYGLVAPQNVGSNFLALGIGYEY